MNGLARPSRYRLIARAPKLRRGELFAVALVLLLGVGGCSDPDPSSAPEASPEGEDTVEPESPAPTSDPATNLQGEFPGEPELAAIWAAFHAAWVGQAAADEPDPAAFEQLATDPEATVELLTAQRGESRLVTTATELWPDFDVNNGRAEIDDCAIVAQHPAAQPDSLATVTIGWQATAAATDDGWRIEEARPLDLFCLPEPLNDELLAAYQAFRDAKDAAWDPPDPIHPDLERTMAGEQLGFIRDLLAEHQRDGIVIRDPAPTDNAVVFEIGIGTATVSDCTTQTDERGAFDLETGERLDDLIPPVADGQLDLQSVGLRRTDDGSWKVVDQAGTRDTNCVPGSTNYAAS